MPVLESAGVRLRCLARQPATLAPRVSPTTEIIAGDLLDPASLDRALAGIDVAYYLVHSMGAHGDYRETDRIAARNFGEAARRAGVRRIAYLGGLATGDDAFSKHLKSRIETGQVLRESGVPVVESRASVVIGASPAKQREPDVRDRWRRPRELRRRDARVRRAAWVEAGDDLGSVADPSLVESLAGTRHARLCSSRARTDRGTEEPVRRHRSHGACGIPDQTDRPA